MIHLKNIDTVFLVEVAQYILKLQLENDVN